MPPRDFKPERKDASKDPRYESWIESIFGRFSALVILAVIFLAVLICFFVLLLKTLDKDGDDHFKSLIAIFGVVIGTLAGLITNLIKKSKH